VTALKRVIGVASVERIFCHYQKEFTVSKEQTTSANKFMSLLCGLLSCLVVCGFGWKTLQADRSAVSALPQGAEVSVRSRPGQPLTNDERDRVVTKALAHPAVAARFKGHRVRALRVVHERVADKALGDQVSSASVTIFDYNTGATTRYVMNLANGELLSEQALPGHPQSSAEERDEAASIIQKDPELSALLQADHKMIGGFIVEAPPGARRSHRYLQMRIVTADMSRTARLVIVDMTDRVIASKQFSDN
jgi:hypothetical protein